MSIRESAHFLIEQCDKAAMIGDNETVRSHEKFLANQILSERVIESKRAICFVSEVNDPWHSQFMINVYEWRRRRIEEAIVVCESIWEVVDWLEKNKYDLG